MDSTGAESVRFSRLGKKWVASSISDPQIVGYYSIDEDDNYLADSSRMSYYKAPSWTNVSMDLNHRIKKAVRFPKASAGEGKLSHFLEWILHNHTEIRGLDSDKWIEPDFVASGGVLTRMLSASCLPEYNWEIRAAKWKGTIYLCPIVTESEEHIYRDQPSKYFLWRYKFKQYMVSDHPDTEPDPSRPIFEPAKFTCIFNRRFGRHSVLFTSVVDAVRSTGVLNDPLPLKDLKLVDLKTKKSLQHVGQWRLFAKNVLPCWWAQSFLSGTDEIVCGWRDKEGIVHDWTTYSLDRMIRLGRGVWDPQTGIDGCIDYLDLIARRVVDECDVAVYGFKIMPNGDGRLTRLPSNYGFISTATLEKMGTSGAA